ncbi:ATP-binding cassette domain-containing protein [Glaciibacter flavus]|uniref:ATP-binding cassette domain-containing protein n=1 Tax=Orlajensenia flava TaxID=2565934 RepID=A0A4S4FYX2_9MICO|nr:polysaccharide ABC transporter ATP-binding protein [Glaciibacter flavus]THG36053.1 ATP-binding cassette domain-containing protein [Glaciibacter flavus]
MINIGVQPLVRAESVSKKFVIHKDKSLKDRILYWRSRSKSRTEFLALDDISFDIALGETVGLIGHNGSGKSTLLKVIGGIVEASDGVVYRRGRVAALLELGAGFHPDLSGRDNVYLNAAILGMSTAQTDAVFDEIVDFSGIGEFIDSQVKFYSSGMYVRLAFAVAVHSDPDLLLVDEVLAVGDEPFQLKCMNKIRQFQKEGRTIVLVSHSAEQVADVCTRAIVLDGGRVVHDGDVGTGIRILRDGYERDRVEHEAATDHHAGAVEILGVTVESVGGHALPAGPLRRGSDIALIVHAEVRRPVGWISGFSLLTPLGQAIYRLNTEGLGIDLPTRPGRYDIRFELPAVNFGVKRLVVTAGATQTDGTPLALLDPASFLDFDDDPLGAGVVQFDARGRVESVQTA